MHKYEQSLLNIKPLDQSAMNGAQKRLDNLTKPLGSLGRMEEFVCRFAGIMGTERPNINKKCIVIMCSDNGVVEEGVSSCPKSVTSSVTQNFTRGITGVNVLSRNAGSDIFVVDVGVDDEISCKGILDRKISRGTRNMCQGPAMTRGEAIKAIETGIEIVHSLKEKGYQILGTGEMGVGNTTTSSAVGAVLLEKQISGMVGKGAGLTNEGLQVKIRAIEKAIELNKPDPKDPIDVLSKVGGYDIAALAGCFIGAAEVRIPILIDGFISGAAALAAVKLEPKVCDFIFPSHGSAEPGSMEVMKALEMEPILNLGMRLGEGTGAAVAFHVYDAAMAAYNEMGTFEDAQITKYIPLE